MKGGSTSQGFTIVETLIVLTVSMAILGSALLLVSGRQNKTAFAQGARDVQSAVQQIISEVSAGYYANKGFSCANNGGNVRIDTTGSTPQGQNVDCIFLGKGVVFRRDTITYTIPSIAGLKPSSGNFQYTNLSQAAPARINGADESKKLLNGIEVVCMQYGLNPCSPSGGTDTGGFALVSSLGTANSSGVLEGAQQVDVYTLDGVTLSSPLNTVLSTYNDDSAYRKLNSSADHRVGICFRSGGTRQSALVQIGGAGRSTNVTLIIKETVDCS